MNIKRLMAVMLVVPFAFAGCGEKEPTLGEDIGEAVDASAEEAEKSMEGMKDKLKK